MSNLKNIFGNEGWIQSAIDRSRFKTRPGEKRRRGAIRDAQRRYDTLKNDPLFQKYGNVEDLGKRPRLSKSIFSQLHPVASKQLKGII